MSLLNLGFSGGSKVKNLPPSAGDTGSIPWVRKNPEKKMKLTPVFLPGAWQVTVHGAQC